MVIRLLFPNLLTVRALILFFVPVLLATACHAQRQDALPKPSPEAYGAEDTILYRPQGQPHTLLGREVFEDEDGTIHLADERKPGCLVGVREIPEEWNRDYSRSIEETAGGGLEVPNIAELKAKYGASVSVAIAIQNQKRLDADLEGDCGARFVRSVRVGTGERFVGKRADAVAAAQLVVKDVAAGGGYARKSNTVESFSWSSPHAWSFVIGSSVDQAGLTIDTRMKTSLLDGEEYRIEVRSSRDAWFIVYGIEASGRRFKLLPDMDHPTIQSSAGENRMLPPLRAGLRVPSEATQETIVIYAFDDAAFAQRFRMPRGIASPEQMAEWEESLRADLETIGQRHFEREEIGYTISPAKN